MTFDSYIERLSDDMVSKLTPRLVAEAKAIVGSMSYDKFLEQESGYDKNMVELILLYYFTINGVKEAIMKLMMFKPKQDKLIVYQHLSDDYDPQKTTPASVPYFYGLWLMNSEVPLTAEQRVTCKTQFKAYKYLSRAKRLGYEDTDKQLEEFYTFVGRFDKHVKFDNSEYFDVCCNIMSMMITTPDDLESLKIIINADDHVIDWFERYTLADIPKTITHDDFADHDVMYSFYDNVYEQLRSRYHRNLPNGIKKELIYAIAYVISTRTHYDSHLLESMAYVPHPHLQFRLSKILIDKEPVFFRYGLFILMYLVDTHQQPDACELLARIYTNGYYRNPGDEYKMIKKDQSLSHTLYRSAYDQGKFVTDSSVNHTFSSYWNLDPRISEPLQYIKELFYDKSDIFCYRVKKVLSDIDASNVLLDWLYYNPKYVNTTFELAMLYLNNVDDSIPHDVARVSGIYYLKAAADNGNSQAKYLLPVIKHTSYNDYFDGNDDHGNHDLVAKPQPLSVTEYDIMYEKFYTNYE